MSPRASWPLVLVVATACTHDPIHVLEGRWDSMSALVPLVAHGLRDGDELHFDLPDDVLGMTIVLRGDGEVGLRTLQGPDTTDFVADEHMNGGPRLSGHEILVMQVPQVERPMLAVPGGSWRAVVSGSPASAEIWVRRTRGGGFYGGAVDFLVHFGATALDEDYVRSIFLGALPVAGLRLGALEIVHTDPVWSRTGAHELFEAEAVVDRVPTVNVFLVEDVSVGDLQVAGVAGGVPGLATAGGTTRSGIALEISGTPILDVLGLRHELGHFAGLYHTSDGPRTDPLSDTIACPYDVFEADPSDCPDVGNAMFPVLGLTTVSELSPMQARVMAASAVYRGFVVEGGHFAGTPTPEGETEGEGETDTDGEAEAETQVQWTFTDSLATGARLRRCHR